MRLRRARPSLRATGLGRLAVQVGAAFALAMLAVGMIGFAAADGWVSNRIDSSLRYHTAKYVGVARPGPAGDAEVVARLRDWQQRKVLSERTYIVFARDGRPLVGRLDIKPPPEGFSDVSFLGGGRTTQVGRALATRLPSGSLLVVVQHSEAAAGLHALLPVIVAAISLAALLMGVFATLLFARLTATRLFETQNAADAIAAGDLGRRIPLDRLDGMFAAQAESLNRMLDRMEQLVRAQRLFSSNLAHDLRTPLTRLQGLLAQGESGDPSPVLDRAERECASIIAIFDALLRLAEIETGRHPSAMRALPLRPLIEDVAETMDPVIGDHGGRLEIGRLDDVTITGDADLINQLLVNLLENVATHTPEGTRASLSLERDGEGAVITVRDDGPGLPAEDRARATLPFERGQAASVRPGSGLGLAIAQAIVRFHRGRLDLADAAPGLEVRVRIPANDPDVTSAAA